jgi:hypothetical protein
MSNKIKYTLPGLGLHASFLKCWNVCIVVEMGQHNTVVVNDTEQTIKVVLTNNNDRNTSQIIQSNKQCIIPTVHGQVTLSVFPEVLNSDTFVTTSVANFTNESNRNFIVKQEKKGRININRLRYGSTTEIQHGLQDTHILWNALRWLHIEPRN